MAFNDPIATNATPFAVKATPHSLAPATCFIWSAGKTMPTNAWWQNLLIPHYDANAYNGKTHTYPYGQWPQTDGNGYTVTYFGDQPGDRDVQARSITLSGAKDISIGTSEAVTTREVTDYTDLGVNLKFNVSDGSMTTALCEGMAFNHGVYANATPKITIEGAILEINGVAPASASLTNITKLKIKTNRYDRVWLVYASTALSFTLSGNSLTATAKYTGSLQVAVMTDAAQETAYDTASTAVLTGGSVNATFSGNTATMTFSFTTTGSGAPLVFTMPHHRDILSSPSYTTVQMPSLRGLLRAIRSSTWTLTEPLTTINWQAARPLPTSTYADIQAALAVEKNTTNDQVGNGWGVSPYYYGKYIAKMARLVLIAQEVGDTATANEIATRVKGEISSYLTATPTGTAGVNGSGYRNALLYQGGATWKGVSTENGLADMGADFGSGRFNDHHFHYGYWIYAAAVFAKDDSSWRATVKPYIDALVRDIANPSLTDTYFPRFRYKDWFVGHSWASGLVGIDVGPDQESTSEAINAWYGVQLWGLANNNTDVMNLGRLMLATEVRSARRYWHIDANSDIYPSPFNANGTAVILRTHKVAVETFFGSRPHYFYGIQSLPYTPATELYMDSTWATRSYPLASAEIPVVATSNPQDTGWNGVIYSMHAVVDPNTGYTEAQGISLNRITAYTDYVQYGIDLDNGMSKANMLYWAATRQGFAGEVTPPDPAGTGTPGPVGSNTGSAYRPYVRGSHLLKGYRETAASVALNMKDGVVAVAAVGSPLTVTLPAQPATGQTILVIDTSGQCSAANTITVTGGTLDGQTSKVLNTSYASLCCYYNGVNWSIVP